MISPSISITYIISLGLRAIIKLSNRIHIPHLFKPNKFPTTHNIKHDTIEFSLDYQHSEIVIRTF
jgi:hypothetical protein